MKLYSYCLRYDGGAAPNPYWGICTLAICKPAIRRTAEVGDWIVGLGSARSPIGDIHEFVVYAMKVTDKLTMAEYDEFCARKAPKKIPHWKSHDFRLRMGDCIYDFSSGGLPKVRWSVHPESEREKDLSGKYALLSKEFYYFGDKPVPLPQSLLPIVHDGQGHKSHLNDPYVMPFVEWITGLGYKPNKMYGDPQLMEEFSREGDIRAKCTNAAMEGEEEG